jgi:hypothetical protein
MSDLKPMSAAEYAAHAAAKDSERPTVIKRLKSGAVFQLRKPDLERMVILGLIPESLLEIGLKAWESSGIKKQRAVSEMDFDTTRRGLIIMREVVADACVQPPFNEVTAKHFSKPDFDEIYHWAMGGEDVEAATGLQRFRKGRKGRAPASRINGSELQPEAVSNAEN